MEERLLKAFEKISRLFLLSKKAKNQLAAAPAELCAEA